MRHRTWFGVQDNVRSDARGTLGVEVNDVGVKGQAQIDDLRLIPIRTTFVTDSTGRGFRDEVIRGVGWASESRNFGFSYRLP